MPDSGTVRISNRTFRANRGDPVALLALLLFEGDSYHGGLRPISEYARDLGVSRPRIRRLMALWDDTEPLPTDVPVIDQASTTPPSEKREQDPVPGTPISGRPTSGVPEADQASTSPSIYLHTHTQTQTTTGLASGLVDTMRSIMESNALAQGHSLRAFTRSRWVADMDRLLRIDSLPVHEVERVIRWSLADSFWSGVVCSPSGLRKHWDKLAAKASRSSALADPFDAARRVLENSENGGTGNGQGRENSATRVTH